MPIPQAEEALPSELVKAEPLRAECQHFLHCCATGQRPRSDGLEGLRVLRVLDQATRSLQERGQPIERNEGRSIDGSFGRDISINFSASVDGEAQVGEGTKIWHFSHVMSGARIGKRSEEHTSELQSLMRSSYVVLCLKKKKTR